MAKGKPNAGTIVLAIYLIFVGLVHIVNLSFANMNIVMGGLAAVAGILLLIGK